MNQDKSTFFKSAFKTVYFAVFLVATVRVVWQAKYFSVNTTDAWDTIIFNILNIAFLVLIGFHTIRLYFTLEMLDEEKYLFENFFLNANGFQRILELFLRWGIIGVVSYKFIDWTGGEDIQTYLLILYGLLFLWGLLVLTFNPSMSYLRISIPGLILAAFLFLMGNNTNSVAGWSIVIFAGSFVIAYDLRSDIKKNWTIHYKIYISMALAEFTETITSKKDDTTKNKK